MRESALSSQIRQMNPFDPIKIINQYASVSTIKGDIIFDNNVSIDFIFCAGIIKYLGRNTYNFDKNEFVGYISCEKNVENTLSSNLVFRLNENNKKLIFILPYASYAMKILRNVDPKLGQDFLFIGFNLFSILLLKLFKLTGANVWLVKTKDEQIYSSLDENIDSYIIENLNLYNKIISEIKSPKVIITTNLNSKIKDFLFELHKKNEFKLFLLSDVDNDKIEDLESINLSKFDIGYLDNDYNSGIKYPYSYIRWDYKRNLEYFIHLIENNNINLKFIEINQINIDSLTHLEEKIINLPKDKLFLFNIKTK